MSTSLKGIHEFKEMSVLSLTVKSSSYKLYKLERCITFNRLTSYLTYLGYLRHMNNPNYVYNDKLVLFFAFISKGNTAVSSIFDSKIPEPFINEMCYHFYTPLRIFITSYHTSFVYGAPHPLCYFSIFFPVLPHTYAYTES